MRHFSMPDGLSACPNGVRHHRVNATDPDPNRRSEATRLARSANPTRGRRTACGAVPTLETDGKGGPGTGKDALVKAGALLDASSPQLDSRWAKRLSERGQAPSRERDGARPQQAQRGG